MHFCVVYIRVNITLFRLSSCLFPPRMQPFSMALEWCTSTIMHFSGKSNSVSSSSVRAHTRRSARITHHFIIILDLFIYLPYQWRNSQLRLSLCFHGNSTTREHQLWLNLFLKKKQNPSLNLQTSANAAFVLDDCSRAVANYFIHRVIVFTISWLVK